MTTRTHKYRGKEIRPVQYADKRNAGYRWYVPQTHGPTGIEYDSQHCPHYYTLSSAKEAIDYELEMTAGCAE